MSEKIKPVLIIGTQRSGSNLLRIMLNQLNEIEAPHPPHILVNFTPLLPVYGNLQDDLKFKFLIEDVCRYVEANPVKWIHMNFNREEIFNRCERNSLIQIFKVIYEIKAELKGANYWCCKSMANLYFISSIENENLEPYYIHLVRDGRDVAASFKRAIVGEKHIYFLALQWKKEQALASGVVKKFGPHRASALYYELFIDDPEKSLTPILQNLGLKWNNEILNYFVSEEAKNTANAGEMWKNVAHPVDNTNKKHYSEKLTGKEIEIFEKVAGKKLVEFSYETHYPLDHTVFSDEEIKTFEIENELMKKQTKELLTKDAALRFPQENILKEIKKRSSDNF